MTHPHVARRLHDLSGMSVRKMSCCGLLALLAASAPVPSARAGEDGPVAAAGSPYDDARIERLRKLHYTESHQVRMVLLPTSVTDRRGRSVTDLTRDDFQLYEDSQPQDIRYFSAETREPISIAFMLDISGSMRQMDKLTHAKEAVRFFVDRLREGDRFALIGFADEQVDWITEFTDDRKRFLDRLSVQRGYGKTALNDAIAAAPGLVDVEVEGRKAIVLITDGVDNSSRLSVDRAVDVARRVPVPVYTIGFMSVDPRMLPKDSELFDLEVLRYVSDQTGGQLFAVHDPDEIKEAVATVDRQLRHQYLLGYYPPPGEMDGGFRQIQVETDRRRLVVRTRRGYYAKP